MDKQTQAVADKRTPMSLERFLYEHSTRAEHLLREWQEKHVPLKASGAEHLGELVRALEFYANRENYLSDAAEYKAPIEGLTGLEVCMTIIDEAGKDAGERARNALSKLPPELRGE